MNVNSSFTSTAPAYLMPSWRKMKDPGNSESCFTVFPFVLTKDLDVLAAACYWEQRNSFIRPEGCVKYLVAVCARPGFWQQPLYMRWIIISGGWLPTTCTQKKSGKPCKNTQW